MGVWAGRRRSRRRQASASVLSAWQSVRRRAVCVAFDWLRGCVLLVFGHIGAKSNGGPVVVVEQRNLRLDHHSALPMR